MTWYCKHEWKLIYVTWNNPGWLNKKRLIQVTSACIHCGLIKETLLKAELSNTKSTQEVCN